MSPEKASKWLSAQKPSPIRGPSPPSSGFGSDLRKFKEAKKQFDKVSEEKEAALIKNAQAPRNKQHEVEEATNILSATRKCFRNIVLDYVLQVGRARGDPPGLHTENPPRMQSFSLNEFYSWRCRGYRMLLHVSALADSLFRTPAL